MIGDAPAAGKEQTNHVSVTIRVRTIVPSYYRISR